MPKSEAAIPLHSAGSPSFVISPLTPSSPRVSAVHGVLPKSAQPQRGGIYQPRASPWVAVHPPQGARKEREKEEVSHPSFALSGLVIRLTPHSQGVSLGVYYLGC